MNTRFTLFAALLVTPLYVSPAAAAPSADRLGGTYDMECSLATIELEIEATTTTPTGEAASFYDRFDIAVGCIAGATTELAQWGEARVLDSCALAGVPHFDCLDLANDVGTLILQYDDQMTPSIPLETTLRPAEEYWRLRPRYWPVWADETVIGGETEWLYLVDRQGDFLSASAWYQDDVAALRLNCAASSEQTLEGHIAPRLGRIDSELRIDRNIGCAVAEDPEGMVADIHVGYVVPLAGYRR